MIKVNIVAVGKVKEKYFLEGILEYKKRLSKYCEINIVEIAEENFTKTDSAIIESIIGKNGITDWKALDASSIPEISPICVFSNTPENTIAKDVKRQSIPVRKVSNNATKP